MIRPNPPKITTITNGMAALAMTIIKIPICMTDKNTSDHALQNFEITTEDVLNALNNMKTISIKNS